jgi:hypothetical protein
MACDCGSPNCPERHGISLRPRTHDAECESELTSHGYTACQCGERPGSRDVVVDGVSYGGHYSRPSDVVCMSACSQKHALGITRDWCLVCSARRAEDRALELLAQRDELLTVLKVFVDEYLGAQYERGMWPLMDQAMDAIAKAEGK